MIQRKTDPVTKLHFYKYDKNILYLLNIKKNSHIFAIIILKLSIFHNFLKLKSHKVGSPFILFEFIY